MLNAGQLVRPNISVIVPVYKEEHSIRPFLQRLEPVLEKIGTYEIIFSLDPSPDDTERVIEAEIARNARIALLVFSRRFGQPAAVMEGIRRCRGESCVVIDVDLQDPPELIYPMWSKLKEGYAVVYAKRRTRVGETQIKRLISKIGYWLINAVTEVKVPRDTGDFRIMSRRVVDELSKLGEGHGFLRGLVAFVGFRQAEIEYDRDARARGTSNYNRYLGSLKIGFNGLIGFSNFMLDLTFLFGLILAFFAFLGMMFVMITFMSGEAYPLGVPTMIILTLFMGGVNLIAVGILGQYVGRVYDEVKRRPLTIIDKSVNLPLAEIGARAELAGSSNSFREDNPPADS